MTALAFPIHSHILDAVVEQTRHFVLDFYENSAHCAQDCTNRHILLFGMTVHFEIVA
jgi:hypothetical protein